MLDEDPPHPIAKPNEITQSSASICSHRRRRIGMQITMAIAMIVPPAGPKRLECGRARVALVGAVVLTINVAVALAGTLQVGASCTLVRLVVTAQLRLTAPVKPPEGVMETIVVSPEVAPGAIDTLPLLDNA